MSGLRRATLAVVRTALSGGHLTKEQLRLALLIQEEIGSCKDASQLLPLLRWKFFAPDSVNSLTAVYKAHVAYSSGGPPPRPVMRGSERDQAKALISRAEELLARPQQTDPSEVQRFLQDAGIFQSSDPQVSLDDFRDLPSSSDEPALPAAQAVPRIEYPEDARPPRSAFESDLGSPFEESSSEDPFEYSSEISQDDSGDALLEESEDDSPLQLRIESALSHDSFEESGEAPFEESGGSSFEELGAPFEESGGSRSEESDNSLRGVPSVPEDSSSDAYALPKRPARPPLRLSLDDLRAPATAIPRSLSDDSSEFGVVIEDSLEIPLRSSPLNAAEFSPLGRTPAPPTPTPDLELEDSESAEEGSWGLSALEEWGPEDEAPARETPARETPGKDKQKRKKESSRTPKGKAALKEKKSRTSKTTRGSSGRSKQAKKDKKRSARQEPVGEDRLYHSARRGQPYQFRGSPLWLLCLQLAGAVSSLSVPLLLLAGLPACGWPPAERASVLLFSYAPRLESLGEQFRALLSNPPGGLLLLGAGLLLLLSCVLSNSVRLYRSRRTYVFDQRVDCREGWGLRESLITVLLTVLTAGLGLPWAITRRKRWFYSCCMVRDTSRQLVFTGTGFQALGLCLVTLLALPLMVVSLGLLGLWVQFLWLRWERRHLLLPDGEGRMHATSFSGGAREYVKLMVRPHLLTLLTVGLYRPWALATSWAWLDRHTQVT